jgi:RimJ/RimL family protein N-acetyltransferase
LYGTPTTYELAERIAELEHGNRTFLTPSGQAAIALIYFAFTGAGDHVLVPDNAYGPNRQLAADVLRRFGVEIEYYPPLVGADLSRLMWPNTRLVWCESPGSVTMEVQDIPSIVEVAHGRGAIVVEEHGYSLWVLERSAADSVIGWCGLRPREWPQEPELLYGLALAVRGQRLASEAVKAVVTWLFGRPEITGVWAVMAPSNIASARVSERVGLTLERRGEFDGLDSLIYRVSAADWRA